jgi:LacI family transcriptional regulator
MNIAWWHRFSAPTGPVVLLDHPGAPVGDQCFVWVDDRLGGELAVSHELERGHQRIAFIGGGTSAVHQVKERHRGARQAMEHAGHDPADLVHIEIAAHNFAVGAVPQSGLKGYRPPVGRPPYSALTTWWHWGCSRR